MSNLIRLEWSMCWNRRWSTERSTDLVNMDGEAGAHILKITSSTSTWDNNRSIVTEYPHVHVCKETHLQWLTQCVCFLLQPMTMGCFCLMKTQRKASGWRQERPWTTTCWGTGWVTLAECYKYLTFSTQRINGRMANWEDEFTWV